MAGGTPRQGVLKGRALLPTASGFTDLLALMPKGQFAVDSLRHTGSSRCRAPLVGDFVNRYDPEACVATPADQSEQIVTSMSGPAVHTLRTLG